MIFLRRKHNFDDEANNFILIDTKNPNHTRIQNLMQDTKIVFSIYSLL